VEPRHAFNTSPRSITLARVLARSGAGPSALHVDPCAGLSLRCEQVFSRSRPAFDADTRSIVEGVCDLSVQYEALFMLRSSKP